MAEKSHVITIDGQDLPLAIVRERRKSWRISLGKNAVILRLPLTPLSELVGNPETWAQNWLERKYRQRPELFNRYLAPLPQQGDAYHTPFGTFRLVLQDTPRRKSYGTGVDKQLVVHVPKNWSLEDRTTQLRSAVSSALATHLKDVFTERLHTLNARHFNFTHQRITLRYNSSNWGSCSTRGNLSFSTRVLLTPQEVMEYVIIHELAHLKIMNHSHRFWSLVASACPDFKQWERWLKQEGPAVDF